MFDIVLIELLILIELLLFLASAVKDFIFGTSSKYCGNIFTGYKCNYLDTVSARSFYVYTMFLVSLSLRILIVIYLTWSGHSGVGMIKLKVVQIYICITIVIYI